MNEVLRPLDRGPLYAETLMSRFPVEPWATATNLVFLLIIFYFARLTKGQFKKHPLTVFSLPVLFIGWLGGTLFHAFRDNNLWLLMDILPIAFLAICGGIYLWAGAIQSLLLGTLAMIATMMAVRSFGFLVDMPRQAVITLGYAGFAVSILLGAFLHSRRNGHSKVIFLIGSLVFISIALGFRLSDSMWSIDILPMGTHWLWHTFGGCAVWCIMRYIAYSEAANFAGSSKRFKPAGTAAQ